jgi:hypothetical protein
MPPPSGSGTLTGPEDGGTTLLQEVTNDLPDAMPIVFISSIMRTSNPALVGMC